ncbi:MAG TPA: DNA replication/repair protein RecF [Gammaproteobacteria bacterium]|nr:DNA replication/repair protein RecF [Gammaproteobacteria bacterium]
MPAIEHLSLKQFRNITELSASFSEGIHFIFGNNGSGKTSLLESLYSLTHGRSFRSRQPLQLIQDSSSFFRVVVAIKNTPCPIVVGWEKQRNKEAQLKIDGKNIQQFSSVAEKLPTLMIDTDSHRQLSSGPKSRRQFIDWKVFHCFPEFISCWRSYQTHLSQRNAALKQNIDSSPWDKGLCSSAYKIDSYRKQIIEEWQEHFQDLLPKFNLIPLNLSTKYDRGWPYEKSLEESLEENRERDRRLGFTHSGPHRADLKVLTQEDLVFQRLSQGQQKIITYAMKLAQVRLLANDYSKKSLVLIDDLPAELDMPKRKAVIASLEELGVQSIITGILKRDVLSLTHQHACFSIDEGRLSSLSNTKA